MRSQKSSHRDGRCRRRTRSRAEPQERCARHFPSEHYDLACRTGIVVRSQITPSENPADAALQSGEQCHRPWLLAPFRIRMIGFLGYRAPATYSAGFAAASLMVLGLVAFQAAHHPCLSRRNGHSCALGGLPSSRYTTPVFVASRAMYFSDAYCRSRKNASMRCIGSRPNSLRSLNRI